MVVPAGSTVTVADSGFAPHAVSVLIEPPAAGGEALVTDVRLDHSSFMLNPGECVVETGPPATASGKVVKVTAADCVFAPVSGTSVPPALSTAPDAFRRGVVVRVQADKPDGVVLAAQPGRPNAYYSVDPLGTAQKALTAEYCKAEFKDAEDKGRVELKQRPWSEPLSPAIASDPSPWKAFRLKVVGADADPAVFTKNADRRWVPLGVAFHTSGGRRAYEGVPITWGGFSRPKTAIEARQKVWYPDPPIPNQQLAPGEYKNLSALLDDVRPGETILIRHTGVLTRDAIELKPQTKPSEGEFKVTFRPEEGSKPILAIRDDAKRDQTLFKLLGGEVTFEDIHFQLRPGQPKERQTVSAVALLGGKSCTFTNCVFTLAEEDESKVAAVHLPDIAKEMVMKTDALRLTPKVTFTNCLIRGRGRGVWVGASRPVALEVTNTLTALNGPVFFAEAGGDLVGGTSTAKFTRVTALAGGPLVEMHGKSADAKSAGLVKLEVETDRCLFVAVKEAGRPLVELDGVDPTDWKSVLTWQVKEGSGNRYANFDPTADLAVIRPGGDGAEKRWTRDDWVGNIGEAPATDQQPQFGTIVFAAPAPALKELGAVKPADVIPKMADFPDRMDAKVLDVGADFTEWKKKPQPQPLPDESKPE